MLGLSARALAARLDGRLRIGGRPEGLRADCADAERPLDAVVVDGRRAAPGTLFVALPGARTDGHAHLPQARLGGATAALVRDAGALPEGMPGIVVRDTLAALHTLARLHLQALAPVVVGVTGSVGKTTAKDFLFQLLGGPGGEVHAAPASYNSEIGLPLAVLGAAPGTRTLVLEYGINAPGEMAVLCGIARPQHCWITAFRQVHLEGMGGIAAVVRETCVLAQAADGAVWMDRATADLAQSYGVDYAAPLRPCGLEESGAELLAARPGAFRVRHAAWGERVLPVVAPHEARVACAAAAIALHLGSDPRQVGARLETLRRPQGRLTVRELAGGVTVIDDAYNASPASLRAALQVLQGWPTRGRRYAVLGTMHELGSAARRLHEEAGGWLAGCGVDRLHAIGPGGAWLAAGAQQVGVAATRHEDVAAAGAALAAELRPGDVVLLKASRAAGLERLLPCLESAASGAEGCGGVGNAGAAGAVDLQPAAPR